MEVAMRHLPTIGKSYIYASLAGMAIFRVVNVNEGTGAIYLVAECPHEKAVEVLNHKVKNKHGETIDVPVFAWVEKEKCWAVNVEWDAWKGMQGPLHEDPMTELTRLTEALGGYEKEFTRPIVEVESRGEGVTLFDIHFDKP
jgi:hypothetical protein